MLLTFHTYIFHCKSRYMLAFVTVFEAEISLEKQEEIQKVEYTEESRP